MLYCFFVCWHYNQESWLEDRDSGFRNGAIKHSLKTRQLILGYIGSTKMHKTIGTSPCILRQQWVSVAYLKRPRRRRRRKRFPGKQTSNTVNKINFNCLVFFFGKRKTTQSLEVCGGGGGGCCPYPHSHPWTEHLAPQKVSIQNPGDNMNRMKKIPKSAICFSNMKNHHTIM